MDLTYLNHVFLGNSIKSYVLVALILFFGLLLKRVISRLLSKLLFKLFGRFGDHANPQVFVSLLIRPIEFLLFIVVIYSAINQLSYPLNEVIFSREITVDKVVSKYEITPIQIFDKLFLFLFIISIFWIVLRIIDFISHVFLYKASLTDSKSDDQMVPFVKELLKILTIIFGIFVMMGAVFDLNVATIIAGLGIGGIAVALAAQDTLQNLLGSFTIFADKPFVVGDLVKLDKFEGTVEKVGFRSTLLRTLDKTMVIIPNKKMTDTPLENLTLRNLRRMKFNVGLKYDTQAATMLKISREIEEYVNKHPSTSNDTLVTFDSFGDSALNIQVLYFIAIVEYNEYMHIRQEINYQIMRIVTENGAGFAFPSQTVYHEYTGKEPGVEDTKKSV
ncbi:mechanosensitive ion channel family protein [Daejeonella oryzae]|uniref:mechanosensitive ion channel family protein n=1 Tax=Daejeonella oryzae TaxID=1122943 RepID=UPI0003FD2B58|nr:mechanosensitive ion channel family protein [Daejeonella oryzae]